ncbi:MAG: hypothetical protein ACHP8A_11960 [Terriglobales bacterium]|jgi:plastocyanin|nr:hypothetical protein [Terriglobales bacterium]
MFRNSDTSNVSRRHFLAVAGSVAAASSLAVGKDEKSEKPSPTPRVQTHYLITLTVDADNDEITYSASNNNDAAHPVPVDMPHKTLTVYVGDEVKWQAKTSGSKPKHRAKVRFTNTYPFKKREFKWSENESDGDTVQPKQEGTIHYYCVAVFDKSKPEVYADDPIIIVGGSDASIEIGQAENKLADVRKQIESVEYLLRDARQNLK